MKSPFEVIRSYRSHNATLQDAFDSRCEVKGSEPFIIQDERTTSWAEFDLQSRRFARALNEIGVGHGMRVAIMARNDISHVLALFALARLGAILVPVNPEFGAREAGYILNHADVSGVICEPSLLPVVEEITSQMSSTVWKITIGPNPAGLPDIETLIDPARQTTGTEPAETIPVKSTDTCIIIYTSGTTGFPKGVMHSHYNLVTAGEANVSRLHLQPTDRIMIILPFFHVNAMFYSLGGTLASGACMILVPRFSASTFWQTAADKGATVVNVIEAVGSILCNRDRSEFRPDHQIRVAYGVRKAAAATFRQEFGIDKLFSGFGMTEIPGVTCNPWEGPDKPGSMGTVGQHPDPSIAWAQCRVVDEQGHDVGIDQPGEFWVKTPIVMQGYFRDPEQTAKAFHDGWLKTGDLVKVDQDGFYYHLSRIKDIIRRRGENIAAAEIEMVVMQQGQIAQTAAVAVASDLGEDEILLVAVAKPGENVSEQILHEWCKGHLAAMKVPRYIVLTDSMPLGPTHKILKSALRDDKSLHAQAKDFQRT